MNATTKPINQMTDDELWAWWLSLSDKWKWLFLTKGLDLELWVGTNNRQFDENYNYRANFDWLDRQRTFGYVKHLCKLTELYLWDNQIQDISALANLTQLTEINLDCNEIQDISPFFGLTQLTVLDLDCNQIQDISPLANLKRLEYIYLTNNPIYQKDIDWLQDQLPNCKIGF